MINRTLQYFKNIKFNNKVKSILASGGKKKSSVIILKNRQGNLHQFNTKRRYSTNTFDPKGQPPNDSLWIIAASIICGGAFKIKDNTKK